MAAKRKGGGPKTPSDGTHHRSRAKQVKKAFERTGMKPPRPGSQPVAEAPADPMAEEGGAGVMPPLTDDTV